jgi:hypothetical protein
MLSKQEIAEKQFAILDIEAWATSSGATLARDTNIQVILIEYIPKRRTEAQGDLN